MVEYKIYYTKVATKDIEKLKKSGLANNALKLIELIKRDPFEQSPRYKRLLGNMVGCYSRRINFKHRLVYTVDLSKQEIIVLRMWSHYEE
ncbi:MAG: Txe/YoeB family addiction module toxin [Mycoplasmatales bacterium]